MTRSQWILTTLAVAAITHVATVFATPRVIMAIAIRRIAAETGTNRIAHPPLATAAARGIVRPSPDLMYSTCAFDVRQHPLRVRAPRPSSYASLSIFADNTDNIFVINDRKIPDAGFDVTIVDPSSDSPAVAAGSQRVEAPGGQGILLFRRTVASSEDAVRVDAERRLATCEPWTGS